MNSSSTPIGLSPSPERLCFARSRDVIATSRDLRSCVLGPETGLSPLRLSPCVLRTPAARRYWFPFGRVSGFRGGHRCDPHEKEHQPLFCNLRLQTEPSPKGLQERRSTRRPLRVVDSFMILRGTGFPSDRTPEHFLLPVKARQQLCVHLALPCFNSFTSRAAAPYLNVQK